MEVTVMVFEVHAPDLNEALQIVPNVARLCESLRARQFTAFRQLVGRP